MRARFVVVIAAVAVPMPIAISAFAQQPQTMRVRGEIVGVDESMLTVRARHGDELGIRLADNVAVSSIVKTQLSEIKPGSYIAVSAMPQADGRQRALHVHIFPEPMRGVAEGHFPWDVQAGSTMTNATVTDTSIAVEGRIIMVKKRMTRRRS